MKYKEIFKSWWFYVLFLAYFLLRLNAYKNIYGINLFFVEVLGILIASIIGIIIMVSLFWVLFFALGRLFKKKVTKT